MCYDSYVSQRSDRGHCFQYFQQLKENHKPSIFRLLGYTIAIITAHVPQASTYGLVSSLQELKNSGTLMFMLRVKPCQC